MQIPKGTIMTQKAKLNIFGSISSLIFTIIGISISLLANSGIEFAKQSSIKAVDDNADLSDADKIRKRKKINILYSFLNFMNYILTGIGIAALIGKTSMWFGKSVLKMDPQDLIKTAN